MEIPKDVKFDIGIETKLNSNILKINETYPVNIPDTLTNYDIYKNNKTPLVIDIGSYQTIAGWASDTLPYLKFDTQISKFRDRKTSRNIVYVGNEVYRADSSSSRSNIRTPFDDNIIINPELLEYMLDYIFIKLGVNTSEITNPIVMSETLCNPNTSRKIISELMFENYNVPSVCYGIDSLFSYYQNNNSYDDGIIISSGNNSSTVIPVINGKGAISYSKRLNYGGFQASDNLQKQLQFKYPTFPSKMNTQQIQEISRKCCHVSLNYLEELEKISKPENRKDDIIVQFPFTPVVVEEIDEEEQKRKEKIKQEQATRFQKQMAKQREEKLKEKEVYLNDLLELSELKTKNPKKFEKDLEIYDIEDEDDLKKEIEKAKAFIKRANNRKLGIEEPEEKEKPDFSLVDVPDDQLTPEQKTQKRKQKMLKAATEAREKIKREKEEEKLRKEKEMQLEEEKRLKDPEGWLKYMHNQHNDIVQKIHNRKKRKNQLSDRRSLASQSRMKSIANLASDEVEPPKRRRRGQDEDTFGMNDDDWTIYREISKNDHSDSEEEDINQLNHLEELLITYDPEFIPQSVLEDNAKKNTIINQLTYGLDGINENDQAQSYQIRLNVEQIRIPEVLFQPSIAGIDQAGIIEIVNELLKQLSDNEQNKIVKNIFLTGGNILYPNIVERVRNEIRSIRPYMSLFDVRQANDPILDPWKGAARWASEANMKRFQESCITRQMYEEMGHDYLKEFAMSNMYIYY